MTRRLQLAPLLLILAPAAALAAPAPRLPDAVRPSRYAVTFEPDLAASTFRGRETIEVEVRAPVRAIVLNAAEVEIRSAKVDGALAVVSYDKANETIALTPPKPLTPGRVTLSLEWSARLSDKLRGFYAAESEGRRYAFTQFEATDARRAFPCFDEPAMKARFEVTAVVAPSDSVVSNEPPAQERVDPRSGKKVVRFRETPRMSTYLVALAVGPLIEARAITVGKTTIRVLSTPGHQKLAGFALDSAAAILPRLEAYFGIPYPYGKLDLVGVPDFAAGAMENAGAIFFRESTLLVDPERSSVEQRRNVAATIAHEMAHQWFGDLVTMQWWDDLWLNEAFASWMETRVLAELRPDWGMWLEFERWKSYALGIDALASTHPIHTPVGSPEEANEQFDGITYSKGAAVLRMLELFLGEESFRRGVSRYLAEHRESNAGAGDLWRALAAESKQPVDALARSWFEQPGYPLVDVEGGCAGGKATLGVSQRRFFALHGQGNAASQQKWLVPLCARGAAGSECRLVDGAQARLQLTAPCGWTLANARRAGFYRVRYDAPSLAALTRVAESALEPPERIGLSSDEWALVEEGSQPITGWLELAAALRGERTEEVLAELTAHLATLDEDLVDDASRAGLERFVDELLSPLAGELGWTPKPGEPDRTRLLRAHVLSALGELARSKPVLDEVDRRLPELLAAPSAADATIGEVVVKLGALRGTPERYDAYLARLRASPAPDEQELLVEALAGFDDPRLVERTLAWSLTSEVRAHDVARVVATLLGRRKTRAQAWTFFREHFDALKKKAPEFGFERVVRATGSFCDEARRREVAAFFADPKHHVDAGARAIHQADEAMGLCIDLKRRESARLA
ncbi:MAG TPA: M1 family metallopeptidase, partial [Polyangia bacterium]|nr:M1 family metallopeptidase [Polyangia bacterium]